MPLLPAAFISKRITNLLLLAMGISLWSGFTFPSESSRLPITNFKTQGLSGWESKSFAGNTQYNITEIDNQFVLKAEANNSASGLFKEVSVDLTKYPYINWRWRADSRLNTGDEREKHGDDYVARIYLVVKGGLFIWKTKAINYVWANKSAKDSIWPNAFAGDNAMMLAVRNEQDKLEVWHSEKRNVLADLKTAFGEDIHSIDVVAVMTDTDNTGGEATAYYGEIFFSKE